MYRLLSKLAGSLKENPAFTILSVALTTLYLALFVFQARVDIQLEIEPPHTSFFRIYWAASDQAFSEKRMAYAQVTPQRHNYHFHIGSLGNIARIRVDPIEYVGSVTLEKLNISQFAYAPIKLATATDFSPLKLNQQIQLVESGSSSGLHMQTTGIDGNLEMALNPQRAWAFPLLKLLGMGAGLIGLALIVRLLRPALIDLRFVPWLLIVAFVLALLMALNTGLNVHPDEVVHLSAVNYYASHLLPPALDSPEAASSYSIFGHSRLSDYQIYYQLAGYFQAIPELLNASSLGGARAFGLLIFALLGVFSFVQRDFRPFALPMLVSAQTWYLYSYTNSDGFALALAVFSSYLAASPTSLLNRFLSEHQPKYYGWKAIGLGMLLGSLLLLKTNYYFFILFLGLYLVWRIAQGEFPDQRQLWTRLIVLALVATSVFAARFVMDIHANGWDSAAVEKQMQEQHATAAYKPGADTETKNPMLDLRDRGRSLGYLLVSARWFEKSFDSAFGVYGFSNYYGSKTYYDLVRYIGLLLLAALLLAVIRSRSRANLFLLLIIGFCSGCLVSASVWNSWTVSFQPQGRYLFPILPMLGILYYHIRRHVLANLVEYLCIFLFLLAIYSFIFTGLANMSSLAGP
ncbi:MAG: hypothetical protein GY726_15610 [Proteobacteria bacterium]|nr:hypothetical protein [Pseudomonadota bacterium]